MKILILEDEAPIADHIKWMCRNILKEKLWQLDPEPETAEPSVNTADFTKKIEELETENKSLQEKVSVLSQ